MQFKSFSVKVLIRLKGYTPIQTTVNKKSKLNKMKHQKLFLSLMAAIAIIAIGIFCQLSSNTTENKYSFLLLQNVEALTDSEDDGTKKFEYPNGAPYTSKCGVAIGKGLFTARCQATVIDCVGGGSGCNRQDCPQHPRW